MLLFVILEKRLKTDSWSPSALLGPVLWARVSSRVWATFTGWATPPSWSRAEPIAPSPPRLCSEETPSCLSLVAENCSAETTATTRWIFASMASNCIWFFVPTGRTTHFPSWTFATSATWAASPWTWAKTASSARSSLGWAPGCPRCSSPKWPATWKTDSVKPSPPTCKKRRTSSPVRKSTENAVQRLPRKRFRLSNHIFNGRPLPVCDGHFCTTAASCFEFVIGFIIMAIHVLSSTRI